MAIETNNAREWWADGPADDPYSDAIDRARDEILGDAGECAAIAAGVRAEFADTINELCSGAYSLDGAADVGRQIARAADLAIEQRAMERVDGWREDRALSRAGY